MAIRSGHLFILFMAIVVVTDLFPSFATAQEPGPEKSLTKCLNSLDFYDATEFSPLQKAGKHPVVPAYDALGRKGFYVYSEDKDGADFYPLPPFSTKPAPYSPVILEQSRSHTGYLIELKVGDEPVIPIEYWDPRRPGEKAKVEEVYPGTGKLAGSQLTPARLHGGGRDAVSEKSQAVLVKAIQERISHLAQNYSKVTQKLKDKNITAIAGNFGIMINEESGQDSILAAIDQDLARDKVEPFRNREFVYDLKRKRAQLVQQIAGKSRVVERHRALYNSNQRGMAQTRDLSAAAIENCKVAPIQGIARKAEAELDKNSAYRSKSATTGTAPEVPGQSESKGAGSAH